MHSYTFWFMIIMVVSWYQKIVGKAHAFMFLCWIVYQQWSASQVVS